MGYQPKGTKIAIVGEGFKKGSPVPIREVNIENLSDTDRLLSYDLDKAHLYKTGKKVIGRGFQCCEKLVEVVCEGRVSSYSIDHPCIARLGDINEDASVVYMMRKGSQYRIGSCRYKYKVGSKGLFGPHQRASKEGVDGLWVIGVYSNPQLARVQEALLGVKYGLPEMCFEDPSGTSNSLVYSMFWSAFPDNTEAGENLARDFGLDFKNPLWRPNDQSMNSLKFRGAFIASAGNLVNGMQMAVNENIPTKGKIPLECWKDIQVSKKDCPFEGHSIYVEGGKAYFADGVMTSSSKIKG